MSGLTERSESCAPKGIIEDTKVKREQKSELLSTMNEDFKSASLVVVTHYVGLTVAEMSELRNKVREAGAKFRVTKNRITRLALAGTQYESLSDLMKGPTAVSFSEDPIAAAKAVVQFAKKNEKEYILCEGNKENVASIIDFYHKVYGE